MVDFKEALIYVAIAIAIVVVVALVLTSTLHGGSYNVSVNLSQLGQTPPSYPYQSSRFIVNISNKGGNNVQDLLVGFYLDGSEINQSTVSIPAGQSVTIIHNYTYQYAGNYSFQAVADPGSVLNIANRTAAKSTLTENILMPETADVYTSIPNNNVTDTQSFTTTGTGTLATAAIAQRYNISLFNQLFGPSQNITVSIVEHITPYVAYANGAYATYANNTAVYTLWLQGSATPRLIRYYAQSFGVATGGNPINTTIFARLSNTVSLCSWYSQGWTKIITYSNNSKPGTCTSIEGQTYNSTQSENFVKLLENNTNLTHYQSGFVYTNITPLESVLSYSKSNLTLTNIFTNSYGFLFASSIKKLNKPINVSALNNTCFGLIYDNGTTHICSYVIPTRNGSVSTPYAMINTTEITSNYLINMYTLANQSSLIVAHNNAARLIQALKVNSTAAYWYSGFRSGCGINNQSLKCKYLMFNYTSNNVTINVTNKFNTSLFLRKINCEIAPGFPNTTINRTILSGKAATLEFKCYNVPVPSAATVTTYFLNLTYKINGTTSYRSTNGTVNVTEQIIAQN